MECTTSSTITLNVAEEYCSSYITFGTWSTTDIIGASGGWAAVESAGTNYFSTSDASGCPLTSYEISVTTGDDTKLRIDATSGAVTVMGQLASYQFTIKACGRSSTDDRDCVTSTSLSLSVREYCQTYITYGTWATTTVSDVSGST